MYRSKRDRTVRRPTSTATSPECGRRAQSKEQRRDAIVAIARRSFLQNGFARTSMSSIAEAMGGSKGTLWSYFRCKEDLFAAMVADLSRTLYATTDRQLDPDRDTREVLTQFCVDHLARLTHPASVALQRLVVAEVDRFPLIGQIYYTQGRKRGRDLLAAYFETLADRGRLRDNHAERAVRMLLGLCADGSPRRLLWGLDAPPTRKALAEEAIDIVDLLISLLPTLEQHSSGC